MKLLLFILLLLPVFTLQNVNAQGWQWATTSTGQDDVFYVAVNNSLATSEGAASVFTAGISYDSVISFGSITLHMPGGYSSLVITSSDTSGNFQWAVSAKSAKAINAVPLGIASDDSGNVLVLAYLYSGWFSGFLNDTLTIGSYSLTYTFDSSSSYTTFLFKVSPVGDVLWAKNLASGNPFGGLTVDRLNNVYVTGSFITDSVHFGSSVLTNKGNGGTDDIFIVKFNGLGTPLWTKSIGSKGEESPSSIALTSNGSYYLFGSFQDTLQLDSTHTLIATATLNSFLAKFDSSGTMVWANRIDSNIVSLYSNAMVADALGNVYVTGSFDHIGIFGSNTLTSQGADDAFLAKWNTSGKLSWAKSAGGNQMDDAYCLALDLCGNIWVSGAMGKYSPWGPVYSMNFGGGHYLAGPTDTPIVDPIFIAAYDTAGNYITSLMLPTGGDDVFGMATDNVGNFYIASDYVGHLIIGSDTLPTPYNEPLYIAKYKYDTTLCYDLNVPIRTQLLKETTLYPNPTSGQITIVCAQPIKDIAIIDFIGQTIYSNQYNSPQIQVDVSTLPTGVYFVKVNGVEVRKFVKQ